MPMPTPRVSDVGHQVFNASSAKLANGEVVHVNDHVYVSPPWSDRDGTPYTIARIIEFVPPSSTPKKGVRHVSSELHVRLSLFYRPSDISGRNVSDFRLLLAAIHTIVEPLSAVRGRCYVRHKDKVDDLIKWKRNPDHFYFVKFFDPYIKREYEVLRTAGVNNIPPHVKETLLSRYEYIIAEKEMVADLLDSYRTCKVCDQWAASQDSVRCELCKQHYHMSCLNPPLLAKPAKGYSWACLDCTIQRRKDVESEKYRFTINGGSAPPRAKINGTKKEKIVISDKADVTYRGWPWRYFGLYTRAEDTLDPDDLIFPRAVTRVGTKYQANVLSWEEQLEADAQHVYGENEAGPSRLSVERGYDPGEKKHESTIERLSIPSIELDKYMEEVSQLRLPVPPYDVTRLNRAIIAYTTMGKTLALKHMQSLKLADFHPIIFTEKETEVFEAELEKNGGLDTHTTGKVLGKRPADVLRYSYIWKNGELKAENEAIRQHRKVHAAHARTNKTLGAPSLGKIRSRAESEATDDEVSLYSASYASVNRMQCAACSTRTSNVWWRCPRSVQGTAMCESCGSNYRKYGVISFVKADDVKRIEKKEPGAPGAKRARLDPGSAASTPVPTGPPKLPPCAWCKRMEPKASMARCKTCTFSVHSSCYGIAPEAMGREWECDLCTNVHLEESHLQPRCVLCPSDSSSLAVRVKPKKQQGDFDVLSALKPTEGCRWAHILCSAWTPEVQYANAATLKTVEGISTVPESRWDSVCSLCGQVDGATIQCTDCEVEFHPSCAWLVGNRFGFEFSLAKPGKRGDVVQIARFRDEAGVMNAGCWCRSHDLEGRAIYDMNDMDPEQNETALQVYTALYKTIPKNESFALLRKATRLDHFITSTVPETPQRQCISCSIDVSPRWHETGNKVECHQCWFKSEEIGLGPNTSELEEKE